MRVRLEILLFALCIPLFAPAAGKESLIAFSFYGDRIQFTAPSGQFVDFDESAVSPASVQQFCREIRLKDYSNVLTTLKNYSQEKNPNDWLYYQLVRAVAEKISPKKANYLRYTLYKWYFMLASGFDPLLTLNGSRLLFYIQSDENIYNIPYRVKEGKQYVCLNYHDYGGNIDFNRTPFSVVPLTAPANSRSFSYHITKLPDFSKSDYITRELRFSMYSQGYDYKVKVNPEIKTLFANYPTVDYGTYFSIPVSEETRASLIPLLKKAVKGLSVKNGVDYLMRFTRYAFPFEEDTYQFGQEKRLTPEQTLLYEGSDCEDRVFFFFYLVKEIYNLPMIVLTYPGHVTIAVKLNKPKGSPVFYKGERYTVCEPTPQETDLRMGELLPELRQAAFEVAYAYHP